MRRDHIRWLGAVFKTHLLSASFAQTCLLSALGVAGVLAGHARLSPSNDLFRSPRMDTRSGAILHRRPARPANRSLQAAAAGIRNSIQNPSNLICRLMFVGL